MGLGSKITMGVLAGVTALAITMPQAEARDGRNAALLGGLFLGAVAGAAIAGNADDRYDEQYQSDDWNRPAPRYEDRSYQRYDPPVSYHRVQPDYSSSYGEGGYGDGCEHPRRHQQRADYGGDGYDNSDGY